jgi:molecular chaperone GrpE
MTERLGFDQKPQPVPSAAVEADPIQTMRALYRRIARLEQELETERVQRAQEQRQAAAAQQDLLNTLLALHDQLAETIERLGVTTNAREAAIVRRTVDFAQLLQDALARYQVKAVETVGKPLDESTSVAVGVAPDRAAPPGTVLRQEQVGYRWPHGLIRPARVIVSGPPEAAPDPSPSQES